MFPAAKVRFRSYPAIGRVSEIHLSRIDLLKRIHKCFSTLEEAFRDFLALSREMYESEEEVCSFNEI